MLFQEEIVQNDTTAQLVAISAMTGMVIAFIIVYMFRQFHKKMEQLKLPVVLIMDIIAWRLYNVGYYIRVTQEVSIPIEDQSVKQLWGVLTSNYLVIPSYGHEEDVIMFDRSFRRVVVLLCQMIGLSRDGPEVHAEWCKDVFPPDIYDVPQKLKEIPDNYIFVRPLGARTWIRGSLRSKLNTSRQMYASMWKIIMKFEQQLSEAYSHNDNFIMQLIQKQNEVYISCWTNMLDVYDVILRERPTTLYTMARLLHIPQSKLAYSSLNTAISHGGMSDAAKYAHALVNTLQGLAKSLDMTMVSAPIHKGMMMKTTQLQQELEERKTRDEQVQMQLMQTLARSSKNNGNVGMQQSGTETGERRV